MPAKLATTDLIQALNDRNLRILQDFDQVENIIKSVSREDAPDLKKALHDALPWIEQRLKRLKVLAEGMEDHYWTLVNS